MFPTRSPLPAPTSICLVLEKSVGFSWIEISFPLPGAHNIYFKKKEIKFSVERSRTGM